MNKNEIENLYAKGLGYILAVSAIVAPIMMISPEWTWRYGIVGIAVFMGVMFLIFVYKVTKVPPSY